jgi:hypothetical protein
MPQPIPESVRSSEGGPASEEASSAERLAGVLAHVVDDMLDSYPIKAAEAAAALAEKTTDLVSGLAHSVGGLLGDIPVPTAPTPGPDGKSLPAAGSLSSGSGSSSSGSAPVLLIAVLVLFSIALVQGKLWWLSCEPLRPRAGPQLALERPG